MLAVPGLRGGGEYGEEWHHAAIRTRKQTTFDDFIAAAEWLIANRYTSAERLAIQGASNGGLLVAACVIQRPELFGAVLAEAGVYDMVRFPVAGQGAGWEGEYGSPDDPAELAALLAYSPVHTASTPKRFPGVLVTIGDHDTRCAPWHSYKLVAALQRAQSGSAPILLGIVPTAGHGGAVTLSALVGELADGYGFLAAAVGL